LDGRKSFVRAQARAQRHAVCGEGGFDEDPTRRKTCALVVLEIWSSGRSDANPDSKLEMNETKYSPSPRVGAWPRRPDRHKEDDRGAPAAVAIGRMGKKRSARCNGGTNKKTARPREKAFLAPERIQCSDGGLVKATSHAKWGGEDEYQKRAGDTNPFA